VVSPEEISLLLLAGFLLPKLGFYW
jgi:hypothetical protein